MGCFLLPLLVHHVSQPMLMHQAHLLFRCAAQDVVCACSCCKSTLPGWGRGKEQKINGFVALASWIHCMDKEHHTPYQFSGSFSPDSSPLASLPFSFSTVLFYFLQLQTQPAEDVKALNPIKIKSRTGRWKYFLWKVSVHTIRWSFMLCRSLQRQ